MHVANGSPERPRAGRLIHPFKCYSIRLNASNLDFRIMIAIPKPYAVVAAFHQHRIRICWIGGKPVADIPIDGTAVAEVLTRRSLNPSVCILVCGGVFHHAWQVPEIVLCK